MLIRWTEIDNFHTVRKTLARRESDTKVDYRGKIKLHGTNAAVKVLEDGTVEGQSRSNVLSISNDNAGFAAWLKNHEQAWRDVLPVGYTVFGEWIGPGVQKGVACAQIPEKVFAVFAIQVGESLLREPVVLEEYVPKIQTVKVIPWQTDTITIDWWGSAETLQPALDQINKLVEEIEICDPWVEKEFGVKGTGEGLVFYPMGERTRDEQALRMFKAKGEKHRVVKTEKAVQLNPEVSNNSRELAEILCTTARMEQGAKEVNPTGDFSMQSVGAFLGWIGKDIDKECQAEFEAAEEKGIDRKIVSKAVTDLARKWYMSQHNSLK